MQSSLFLAQLIGATALVLGCSLLLQRKMIMDIYFELSVSRALSYFLGSFVFIIGLVIVLNHNVWQIGYPLIITILGWGVLLEGAFYLFMSPKVFKKYMRHVENEQTYYLISIAYLIIGLYLSYYGFLS